MKPCKRGHTGPRYTGRGCVECCKAAAKARAKAKPLEKLVTDRASLSREKVRLKALVRYAKQRSHGGIRAPEDGLLVALLANCPAVCPVCSEAFKWLVDGTGHNPKSPSLDRVINSLGYTIQNTRIICRHCNEVKSTGDALLHRKIANYIDEQST